MKIQNEKPQALTGIVTIFTALLLGVSVIPAFATSDTSSGPWTLTEEVPSYSNGQCTGSSAACAYAPSSGIDQLVAISTSSTVSEATAYNNYDGTSVGSSPSISSSASTIDYNANISYYGQDTISSSGYVAMTTEVDMYDQNGFVGYCDSSPVNTSGSVSGSYYTDCSLVNSGSNTFYEGVFNDAQAQGGGNPSTSEAYYWGGTSSGYAETNSMTICDDGSCYK
ncbi:MAG: hypothetical protein WAN47_08880 [Nitrosotalea sp.]